MNVQKITGFILLGIGVAIVLYTLFASYGIFTGANEPPELFQEPTPKQSAGTTAAPQDIEAQVNALLGQQLQNLLPENTISRMLNLFAWSAFAGLAIFGGTQLAGLGVKLLASKTV